MFSMRSLNQLLYFPAGASRFIERVIGKYNKIPESKVPTEYNKVLMQFERDCLHLKFNKLLEMLEAIINDRAIDDDFAEKIRRLFEIHGAAYWLDTSRSPYQFIPSTSKEQGDATRQAIETVEQSGIVPGAATHLRKAIEHLNAGRYAESISDSIHAVESVARVIDPRANRTLSPALDSLETAGLLSHPALKNAFNNLYGYTSDEQGIRHALLERNAADVGLGRSHVHVRRLRLLYRLSCQQTSESWRRVVPITLLRCNIFDVSSSLVVLGTIIQRLLYPTSSPVSSRIEMA